MRPSSTRPLLVIASGNAYKVAEISAMLDAVDLEVCRQPEGLEIEETGSTYLENARLKATEVARITAKSSPRLKAMAAATTRSFGCVKPA